MRMQVPLTELEARMNRFRAEMDLKNPDWEIAVIFSKVNQFYFTGTMQDGMLVIPRDSEAVYWVRMSYERAMDESVFPAIRPMGSYRDAAGSISKLPSAVYLETEKVPLALYQRFSKHFPFKEVRPVDSVISAVRAIKSSYELDLMKRSGAIHRRVLEERIPRLLREGMSEAELGMELMAILLEEGHQGAVRFNMYDTDVLVGHINFGESSLYPTAFHGPLGNLGLSAAIPQFGSRERKLQIGDLVVIDIGCGVGGYHTDKTVTYMFGKPLPPEVIAEHKKCVDIQNRAAEMLKPGMAPAEIYKTIINSLDAGFLKDFMGYGNRKMKFIGHGIGLHVDELPVIAEGFNEPMQEGMAFALEPKKGIEGIGMVGIENTFLVTHEGGCCITGDSPGLILV